MITSTQAQQYLDQALGVSVPSFIVDAAVAKVAAAEQAMVDAGYSAHTQLLVQTYAVALIASAGAPRRIQSQGAPSGASRSFKNDDGALTQLRRSLASLDTAGTVADLIGPDPASNTLFMVVC
ncbi:hypothetical protein LJR039_004361 [Pseudorhodoferax sp. LjRoot39]|uniref:DUF7370 family protein n=1 Tax=Pseudorhodoferax sp. LjRoot39 TaxID=3342328 RepID=UPI003ECDFD87